MYLFENKSRYNVKVLPLSKVYDIMKNGSYIQNFKIVTTNHNMMTKKTIKVENRLDNYINDLRELKDERKPTFNAKGWLYKTELSQESGKWEYVKGSKKQINISNLSEKMDSLELYKTMKSSLSCFVSSVEEYDENGYKIPNISRLSNYITLDIDHVEDIDKLKHDIFNNNNFVESVFVSPSGNGLKIICKYQTDFNILKYKNNEEVMNSLWYHLSHQLIENININTDTQLVVDENAKDINRLCFLSYDPELLYRKNPQPYIFEYFMYKNKEIYVYDTDEEIVRVEKEYLKEHPIIVYNNDIKKEIDFINNFTTFIRTRKIDPYGAHEYVKMRNTGWGLIDLFGGVDNANKEDVYNLFRMITINDSWYGNYHNRGESYIREAFNNIWSTTKSDGNKITYGSLKYMINEIKKDYFNRKQKDDENLLDYKK